MLNRPNKFTKRSERDVVGDWGLLWRGRNANAVGARHCPSKVWMIEGMSIIREEV